MCFSKETDGSNEKKKKEQETSLAGSYDTDLQHLISIQRRNFEKHMCKSTEGRHLHCSALSHIFSRTLTDT